MKRERGREMPVTSSRCMAVALIIPRFEKQHLVKPIHMVPNKWDTFVVDDGTA
jgi:hypothetical protein